MKTFIEWIYTEMAKRKGRPKKTKSSKNVQTTQTTETPAEKAARTNTMVIKGVMGRSGHQKHGPGGTHTQAVEGSVDVKRQGNRGARDRAAINRSQD